MIFNNFCDFFGKDLKTAENQRVIHPLKLRRIFGKRIIIRDEKKDEYLKWKTGLYYEYKF